MNYAQFITALNEAYEHRGGLKTMRLGRLDGAWFAELQREAAVIINTAGSSDVTAATHVTNWTRPKGAVRQFSLFNKSGRSDDYKGDYGYRGNVSRKRLVFPECDAIKRLAALFGGSLRNMRLNGMGSDLSLSAHEENSITPHRWGTTHIVRFHVPVFTSDQAFVYLDDERFHYGEGQLYFFHHGCVHAAANYGEDVRYHIVLDCFLDRALYSTLFADARAGVRGFRKFTGGDKYIAGAPHVLPEFICEDGRVVKGSIQYGRRAPTALDYYQRNYPSLFPWRHTAKNVDASANA